MTYANGRICNDADSHVMETFDWVSKHADPSVRERLLELDVGARRARDQIKGLIEKSEARIADPALQAKYDHNVVAGSKGWLGYGAFDKAERQKAMDDLGFRQQLVFATFSGTQYLPSKDLDVLYGGVRAHNRAMADFCGGDARLAAVGQVSLVDPKRAVEEIHEGVRLGCKSFWIPASPAGERSPGHPDLDPVWAALQEAGTPFLLHVGVTSRLLPKGYLNNRQPDEEGKVTGGESLRIKDFMIMPFAPQMFLSALVVDGVFERFPNLRGGVIELGAGWVPEYLRAFDYAHRVLSRSDANLKKLAMKPSEYIRRAVRFTPFPGEDVGRMIRDAGPELFLFSSDYPHPEGTDDPIRRFERTLDGIDEAAKDQFYRTNYEAMMGAA
jgi:predicted TIM-barrel fold metal-dependent hydrolase